jgi:bis(5'-nucleosyl)-tetraphosphatase (symmetrical)
MEYRTIFIGDIHGCAAEFRELLLLLEFTPASDRLYLTGDGFARGPDPGGVLDLIIETGARSVLGNHDWKLVRCIENRENGAHPCEKFTASQTVCVERMWHRRAQFKLYLESLPISIISKDWMLTHAGVHPEKNSFGTDRRTAMLIRTYPNYDSPDDPHWYDLYKGKKLVIFGHDARGGLVRRERGGRPVCIGLDTGCVYGGRLSAFILEEDRIVQVQSKNMYYDPVKKLHLS